MAGVNERGKRYIISIPKGDNVRGLNGRDAGKSGRVLSINPKKNTIIVEHANIIKRHTKPNPAKNIKGGIVEKEGPIHASNGQVVCGNCGKHTRISHNTLGDGSRVRACKRCGTTLDK